MKGIYFNGKEAVYREDLEKPAPAKTQSLIRILEAGICNTDKEVMRGYRPDFQGVMGHEFTGIVEASDDPGWIGKRVVGELNAGCGHCRYCRTGREKHCESRKVIGLEGKDGCFAEYMTLETHLLHEIPAALATRKALLTEPLAAALEIPQQIHLDPEAQVLILGDGRLAYLIAGVLHLQGVELTVLGKHPDKLAAFAAYGKTIVEPAGSYDVVVDATGSPSGLETGIRLVRRRGTIVLKSTYAGKTPVDMSYFAVHEITLRGSRCGPFGPALRLLEKNLVQLPAVEFYDLKDYKKAFAAKAFKAGFQIGGGMA